MAKRDKAVEMAGQMVNDPRLFEPVSDFVYAHRRDNRTMAVHHAQIFLLRLFTIMESYEGFNIYEREE